MNIEIVNSVLNEPISQQIIADENFYFQKGQDALKKWLNFDVNENLKAELIRLSKDYDKFQIEARVNAELKNVLELFFEIISYCDTKAKDKHFYNQYEDKRCIAMAYVRMNNWVEHLILFKFSPNELGEGSTNNAFKYLLDPENNATILSENHRELVSTNLIKKEFKTTEFVSALKTFFEPYKINITNSQNYTHLLSRIIYSVQNEWKEEVVALLASDGTGWQDEFINDIDGFDACILWNSKRPSGTTKTLKFLRRIIDDNGSFNLYYSSGGNANYRANIVDFAESQEQLDKLKWSSRYKILYYHDKFSEYKDNNKQAYIVFLAKSLEKIAPIALNKFGILKGFDYPRQDNISPVKKEPEEVELFELKIDKNNNEIMNLLQPLNQILYGPPGTGKTYNTINKALQIINEKEQQSVDWSDRKKVKELFDKRLKDGQIVFTTFHQSMSYEDFIEGIKPLEPKQDGQAVNYKIIDGTFKRVAKKAKENFELSLIRSVSNVKIPFDTAFDLLKQKIENGLLEDPVIIPNEMKKGFVIQLASSFFSITGVNGASIRMMTRTGNEQNTMTKPTLELIFEDLPNIEKYVSGGMRTYYKALVEEMYKWQSDIKYLSQNITLQNYVLIIDEINRGNVSQIFGELITLIEEDKRLGKEEALEASLTYSKDKFGVPPNLYIIGTMNTADRSVEALDAALRRRFSFEEMLPKPKLIATEGKLKVTNGILDTIDLPIILSTINLRIEKLLDKDHQIGHSYFMNVAKLSDLQLAFQNKIIPLLQEYFFGDYGKIGLVIGKGFFEPAASTQENIFADFDDYDASAFSERLIYKIKNITEMNEEDFIEAINTLLKK